MKLVGLWLVAQIVHGQISPETILPMHERRNMAALQTKNVTDPGLDIHIAMNVPQYPVERNDMIIEPYWHTIQDDDSSRGRIKMFSGYELQSKMIRLKFPNLVSRVGGEVLRYTCGCRTDGRGSSLSKSCIRSSQNPLSPPLPPPPLPCSPLPPSDLSSSMSMVYQSPILISLRTL